MSLSRDPEPKNAFFCNAGECAHLLQAHQQQWITTFLTLVVMMTKKKLEADLCNILFGYLLNPSCIQ